MTARATTSKSSLNRRGGTASSVSSGPFAGSTAGDADGPLRLKAAEWLFTTALVLAAASPFAAIPSPDVEYLVNLRFVSLMLSAALMLAALGVGGIRQIPDHLRSWTLALAAFAAVAVVSASFSGRPAQLLTYGAEKSAMGAPTWVALAVIAWGAALSPARRLRSLVFGVLVGGACLAVLSGTSEWLAGGPVTGTFGNGNYLGTGVVVCLPLALVLVRATTGWLRAAAGIAAAYLVWGVSISGSATVLAVLCTQLVVAGIFAPRLVGARSDRARRLARGVAAVVLLLLVAAFVLWRAAPATLPAQAVRVLDEQVAGPTLLSRAALWKMGLTIWTDSPVLGAGPDGLDIASQRYLTEDYVSRSVADEGMGILLRDPHLLPLLLLSTLGVVGLAAGVWVGVAWARTVKATLPSRDDTRRDESLLILGACASFILCMLLIPWVVRYGAMPALISGLALASGSPQPGARPARLATPSWVTGRLIRAASIALACLFAWLGASAAVGQYAITRSTVTADPQDSLVMARLARRAQPTRSAAVQREAEVTGELMLGELAEPDMLVDAYELVPETHRSAAPFEAAIARSALDHIVLYGGTKPFLDWASAVAESAASRAPGHPEAQMEIAHAMILRGQTDEAARLIDRAEAVDYPPPRVAVYRYYIARSDNDTATAAKIEAFIAARAPDYRPLLTWPEQPAVP